MWTYRCEVEWVHPDFLTLLIDLGFHMSTRQRCYLHGIDEAIEDFAPAALAAFIDKWVAARKGKGQFRWVSKEYFHSSVGRLEFISNDVIECLNDALTRP